MISFNKLGELGRFGNQLFQYSYLRSQGERLGVEYSCPNWIGDTVFDLNEQGQRLVGTANLNREYREPIENCGFNQEAIEIEDGTNVWGFFQTEKYALGQAREWFNFKQERLDASLRNSIGLHLRFGDYVNLNHVYLPMTRRYLEKSLELLNFDGPIVVFSDDLSQASEFIKKTNLRDASLSKNKSDIDDFFSLASCNSHIICNSSFSWWAAYLSPVRKELGQHQNVVYPTPWFNPNWKTKNADLGCEHWQTVDGRSLLSKLRSRF